MIFYTIISVSYLYKSLSTVRFSNLKGTCDYVPSGFTDSIFSVCTNGTGSGVGNQGILAGFSGQFARLCSVGGKLFFKLGGGGKFFLRSEVFDKFHYNLLIVEVTHVVKYMSLDR